MWVFNVCIDSLRFTKCRLFLPLQDDYFRTWSPGKPFDQGKFLLLIMYGIKLKYLLLCSCSRIPTELCHFLPLQMVDLKRARNSLWPSFSICDFCKLSLIRDRDGSIRNFQSSWSFPHINKFMGFGRFCFVLFIYLT